MWLPILIFFASAAFLVVVVFLTYQARHASSSSSASPPITEEMKRLLKTIEDNAETTQNNTTQIPQLIINNIESPRHSKILQKPAVFTRAQSESSPFFALCPPFTSMKPCLLVEDNLVNQKVASHMLSPFFSPILVANNGQEAVDTLLTTSVKLSAIFMDITMPVMDGFVATARIRALPKWRGIPIIALTAVGIASQKQCSQFGMDAYLPKPLHSDQLRSVLEELSLIPEKQVFISRVNRNVDNMHYNKPTPLPLTQRKSF